MKSVNRAKEPARTNDEWDLVTGWRRVLVCMDRPGLAKRIKRRMNRRHRRRVRQQIKGGAEI